MKYISFEKGKIVEEKACQSMTWIRETFSCRLELISFRNCWSMILPSGSVPKKLWPIPVFEIWTSNDVIAVMEFDRHYISNILAVLSIAFSSVLFPTGIWLYILQHKIVITHCWLEHVRNSYENAQTSQSYFWYLWVFLSWPQVKIFL